MRKVITAAALLVALALLAAGQSFEVASIRAGALQDGAGEGSSRESIGTTPDTLVMRSVTLRACMSWAYNVQEYQIDGPASIAVERYDIAAKASKPATVEELKTMLRALLAERFRLSLHHETKLLSALALGVAKGGPKLQESAESGPGEMRPNKASMSARHTSMQEFAGSLAGPLRNPVVDLRNPVVDKTGLTGRYDFTVDLMAYFPDNPGAKGGAIDFVEISKSAFRDQLGLTLEPRKEAIEILVVDHVEKAPTEN
jgi:uncharacterized protein (TIGR03435 family)